MDRKTKLILSTVSICLLVLVIAFPSCRLSNQSGEELSGAKEQLRFQSCVVIDVYRPIGDEMVLIYHHESRNVITNVGLHVLARELADQGTWQWTAAQGGNDKYYRVGGPRYIALSSDATGADAAHSSWQAVDGSYGSDIEITTGGLQRARGDFTSDVAYTPGTGTTTGSHTYAMSGTFTVEAGSSFTGVQKAGLFTRDYDTKDGSTSGNAIAPLVAENTFTPVDLNAGDQIAITWRITLG